MTTSGAPRPIAERHLFGPGPCNPYPEATLALAAPLLGHLDPDFLARPDRVALVLAAHPHVE